MNDKWEPYLEEDEHPFHEIDWNGIDESDDFFDFDGYVDRVLESIELSFISRNGLQHG